MPLSLTGMGESALVRAVRGADAVKQRLEALGFTPGCRVTVVSRMGGTMIVRLKDARIALSCEMAHRILV